MRPFVARVLCLASLTAASSARAQPAEPDPCIFTTTVRTSLEEFRDDGAPRRPDALPAGTRIELLSAFHARRRTSAGMEVVVRARDLRTGREVFVSVDAARVRRCQDHRAGSPDIREQRRVVFGGVEEIWRLRFTGASTAPTMPPPHEWTCPDRYEAQFDAGAVVLERLRGGVVIEAITAVEGGNVDFGGGIAAYWQVPNFDEDPPSRDIGNPWETLLDIGDYNHDGDASEFVLPGAHICCGHAVSFIVGVTRDHPRLHVLTWRGGGAMTLPIERGRWEAVRARPRGEIVTWGCGDHASEHEERMRWWPAHGGLRVAFPVRQCPESSLGAQRRSRR